MHRIIGYLRKKVARAGELCITATYAIVVLHTSFSACKLYTCNGILLSQVSRAVCEAQSVSGNQLNDPHGDLARKEN